MIAIPDKIITSTVRIDGAMKKLILSLSSFWMAAGALLSVSACNSKVGEQQQSINYLFKFRTINFSNAAYWGLLQNIKAFDQKIKSCTNSELNSNSKCYHVLLINDDYTFWWHFWIRAEESSKKAKAKEYKWISYHRTRYWQVDIYYWDWGCNSTPQRTKR